MKKLLCLILTAALLLSLAACGTSAEKADFSADSVIVYDLCEGWSREITDPEALAALSGLDSTGWTALRDPAKQVSACAVYVMDFGNGTVVGYLGDGYIVLGTGFEWRNDERTAYRIADSVQYQVPQEVTALLWEIITAE